MLRAKVNGVTLFFRLDGPEDGIPLMLSNSLLSRLEMWEPQISALTENGFKVLRYDSRGHGRSDAPAGAYSMEMLADDLAGLLDVVGWERAHFCGLSKGGMVGQVMGTRHPTRLRSLILCDTSAYMGPVDVWEPRIEVAKKNGVSGLVESSIDRWFTEESKNRIPLEVEKVKEMICQTPLTGFIGCCRAIQELDRREANKKISVPTLIIVGAHDPGTDISHASVIHKAISGSQLSVIDSAAHLTNIEQPARFNDIILKFLNELSKI